MAVVNHRTVYISIHALREEGDHNDFGVLIFQFVFLSTPSARRATGRRCHHVRACPISIHALREEGDRSHLDSVIYYTISIHALREEGDQSKD